MRRRQGPDLCNVPKDVLSLVPPCTFYCLRCNHHLLEEEHRSDGLRQLVNLVQIEPNRETKAVKSVSRIMGHLKRERASGASGY
jgi:hypothetical protein